MDKYYDVDAKTVTNTKTEAERNPASVLVEELLNPNGSIERQEKKGQQEFVASDVFPVDCPKEELEELGFGFHGPVVGDAIFQYVTLPKGWTKKGSDHDMWSYIHDAEGVERVAVFYKAAFYDRSAFARINRPEVEEVG